MSESHSLERGAPPQDHTFPLSSLQQDIWIDQSLHPGIPLYNIGAAFRTGGGIVPALLERAINLVANGNDALRIVLCDATELPRQKILASVEVPLRVVDLSEFPDAQERARELLQREFSRPFDLSGGLLWDTLLVRVGSDCHYWLHRHHHLVSDGTGVDLMAHAVEAAYNRLLDDPDAKPIDGLSYREFVAEDRTYFESARFERDRRFWAERFSALPPPLLDRSDAIDADAAVTSGQLRWTIARHTFDGLATLASTHGFSVTHVLLAVIAAYFARTRDTEEVVIGLAVHNRSSARHKRTLGMFASVMPLGVHVDQDGSLVALMGSIAAELRRCYRHQRYPLAAINRRLKPVQAGRKQIFDLTFSFEDFGGEYCFGGEPAKIIRMESGFEQTPLAIAVLDYHAGDDVVVDFNYNREALSSDEVAAMQARIAQLLCEVDVDPPIPVARLPLLTPAERERLAGLNATTTTVPVEDLVHHAFQAQAKLRPGAAALVYGDESLGYGELNRRANRIAHWLLAKGVLPDDRVAVCARRGPELIAALLGVLKAGAAYVPLDPDYPGERIAYMLADSAPVALLTQDALANSLALLNESIARLPTLMLDASDGTAGLEDDDPDGRLPGLTPDSLAYVIYTSGSTGQPKGVMVEHRNVVNQIATHCATCELSSADRVLQFASISFDSAVVEIFPALSVGACVVLRPPQLQAPDAEFADFLGANRITIVDLPTAFWSLWTQQIDAGRSLPGAALRLVVVGGEKTERRHLAAWLGHPATSHCRWINTYGPSEATVYSTSIAFDPRSDCPAGEIPIGRPTANTRIHLLDARGQPVPPGVTGEICIAGAGVARGYLNRPELTAARFTSPKTDSEYQERFYRTGDLGRWAPDGNLTYHGRNDFQVKIRGFRIELGEIEARLADCEGVRDAVVLAREDVPGDQRLVAYVVPADGVELAVPVLREQLADVLAAHMVPGAFVVLHAMPLTPNGKVDRSAFPAPDQSALACRSYEPPQDGVEEAVAAVWRELLGVDRVGRLDHFFELGGHSLLVIALIERLRLIGLDADVRMVFNAPNLAALAARLGESGSGVGRASAPVPPNQIPPVCHAVTPEMLPLVRLSQAGIDAIVATVPGGVGNVQDIYPLAPLQEGMLFHHLLDSEGDAYLMQSVLSFDDRGRLDAFLEALQAVIDRHDILRSAVHWQGLDMPVQVVQRVARLPVQERTLGHGVDALAQLLAMTDPRSTRIDLQSAPLMAAWVAADPRSGRWFLALLDHHIVCDHVTLELMIDEVGMLLQGRAQDLPAQRPFRDFIAQAQSVPVAAHERYFRRELGDVSEPTVPFGVLEAGQGDEIKEARMRIDPHLAGAIRVASRRHRVTPAVLFHLAWAQVVARTSGRDDVVFGTVLTGRLQGTQGADRVLGMFLNTLPLRIPLRQARVIEAVRDTQERLGELLAHEHASLALAQRCSSIGPSMPLFTALFNYRHSTIAPVEGDEGIEMPGWDGMRVLKVEERTNYPLGISVDDLGTDFALTAQCVAGIDPQRVVAYLAEAVAALVDALEHSPNRPMHELAILPEDERRLVLDGFNAGGKVIPAGATIQAMFERQVARDALAPALVHGAHSLGYAQLDARAMQVADRLLRLGIQPDDRVAICMGRGMEMVVAMLGVLKAGGAYVPLDPVYPADRLSYMLADSKPKAVLVRSLSEPGLSFLRAAPELPVLMVDAGDAPGQDCVVARAAADGSRLAYVTYTSGSTGRPKGVMVAQAGVCNLAVAQSELFGIGPGSRVLQFASFSFDASVSEIAMTLCSGACLHLASSEDLLPGRPLVDTLRRQAITHVTLPSSALSACGDEGLELGGDNGLTVIVAGDVLPPVLARRWAARHRLFNAYGPTEATVCATVHRCGPDEQGAVPIGRPLANVLVRILDAYDQPVPLGVSGEIHVGGVGVARGYLDRPELTAERFVQDPFDRDPAARLYRTGDLGRWRADGSVEFLGRNDFQVKIRGFRVEPGEIESQLLELREVREAVVIVREDVPGDPRLVAYVVLRADAAASVSDLRKALSRVLAEHMVPAGFVFLPALPLTGNGKLDRTALPAPGRGAATDRAYQPPVGDVELEVARLWQALLGIDRVGRHDHFFELGGHSLLAVQLVTRLRERFEVDLPLKTLFEHARLSAMAERVIAAQLELFCDSDMAGLEDELDALSENELRALLMEGTASEY